MNRVLFLSPAAKSDIREIAAWYDDEEQGLGGGFKSKFQDALRKIRTSPEAYRERNSSGIRLCHLSRFPYSVYFRIRKENIRVIAIIHTSRDPKYITRRIR